jgi:hypothetical protein
MARPRGRWSGAPLPIHCTSSLNAWRVRRASFGARMRRHPQPNVLRCATTVSRLHVALCAPGGGQPSPRHPLAPQHEAENARIGSYADGSCALTPLGKIEGLPLYWVECGAVARSADPRREYPTVVAGAYEQLSSVVAPLSALSPPAARRLAAMDLLPVPLADLCRASDSSTAARQERVIHSADGEWRARAERRARWLMRRAERRVALDAVISLRAASAGAWLMQDGGLARLMRQTDPLERWTRVMGCVKSHACVPGGTVGERALSALRLGERSCAFQARASGGMARAVPLAADDEPHGPTPIAWYLRVRAASPYASRLLAGVVRLEVAPTPDWRHWVEGLSWSLLELPWTWSSAPGAPGARGELQCAGILDCERFLRAQRRLPAAMALPWEG